MTLFDDPRGPARGFVVLDTGCSPLNRPRANRLNPEGRFGDPADDRKTWTPIIVTRKHTGPTRGAIEIPSRLMQLDLGLLMDFA
ncbi:hypothetical protein AVO44_13870 [Ruegeria profundi]|uniref:Uncharacterized protein n=1 Tax=Ruegeria profundi TaxID=1685378 RepID=A0A0X3TY07_9RHOB|nr:hypothetical protein AVO44_13870 [Ruegeria profundi]